MWDLPGPGLEPTLPALADGFLPTAPPGKSLRPFKYCSFLKSSLKVLWIKPSTHKKTSLAFSSDLSHQILKDWTEDIQGRACRWRSVSSYCYPRCFTASLDPWAETLLPLPALTSSASLRLPRTLEHILSATVFFSTTPTWKGPFTFYFPSFTHVFSVTWKAVKCKATMKLSNCPTLYG